jgi:hypothetical protein
LDIGLPVDVRHRVVVVEHHRVVTDLFELSEFPVEALRWAGRGTVRILTFADVPGTEAEFVGMSLCHIEGNDTAKAGK